MSRTQEINKIASEVFKDISDKYCGRRRTVKIMDVYIVAALIIWFIFGVWYASKW